MGVGACSDPARGANLPVALLAPGSEEVPSVCGSKGSESAALTMFIPPTRGRVGVVPLASSDSENIVA